MDRANHSAETAGIQLGKKIVHKNRVEQGGTELHPGGLPDEF